MAGETIQLLERWHAGDRRALEELIARNIDWVSGQVRRRMGEHLRQAGQTQDFVQAAMVEVLEYGPRFVLQDEEQFRRLLARIVENQLRQAHRHMHQDKRDVRKQRQLGSDTILYLDPPQRQVTRPSQRAEKDEKVAWVRLALELLPARDREIILLHKFEGLGFVEIAARTGLKEDAARMRFNRALPRLVEKVVELKAGRLPLGEENA